MSSTTAAVAALTLFVVVVVVAWFATPLLKDLARTSDEDLRYLTRKGWAVAIVATFPLGAIMYMRYGKGPDRYV